jgi:putative PIN family toxin of toxin-antitoxin system
MNVVIDTNIFVASVMSADGAARQIIRLCLLGGLNPLMGNALFLEYEDVCAREELFSSRMITAADRDALLDAFFSSCTWVPIYFLWRPNLRDEADNHLIELALAGNASVIITENTRDFAAPELDFPELKICNAAEFLAARRYLS